MTTARDPQDLENNIARKAAGAVLWNFFSFGLGKGLVFVTTAILARLLSPADFGLVGFATLAVTYLSLVKDLGLGAALIRQREEIEKAANTVIVLNILLGISLFLVSFLVAPLVAAYFRNALVTPILRVLGLSFPINALGSVHTVLLQRELDFRRKLVPDLGQSIVKGIVSIVLAVTGSGVWALVYGQLAGSLISSVLSWWVLPWRPQLSFDWTISLELLRFGVSIVGVDALAIVTDNLDYLIVGRVFGDRALGIYTLAYRLPEILVINLLWVMGAVFYPTYAAVQDKPDSLREGFLATVKVVGIVVTPVCVGLVIVADPLVRVAFGEQWLDAVPLGRVLAVYALVLSIGYHAGGVYKAVGRPDILVKLSVLTLLVLLPSLIVGSQFGLIGIAVGHIVAVLFRAVMRLIVVNRFIHVTLRDILSRFIPALLSSAALAALALSTLYLTSGMLPVIRLLAVATAGATGYVGVLWMVDREDLLQLGQKIGLISLKRDGATA